MADREVRIRNVGTEPMAEEDDGHTCIYVVEDDDRNFKVCVYCGHTKYRTDEELLADYSNRYERKNKRGK